MNLYQKISNTALNVWALGMFLFLFGIVMPARCWLVLTTGCSYVIKDPG